MPTVDAPPMPPAFRFALATSLASAGAIALVELEVDQPDDLSPVLRAIAGIAPRPREGREPVWPVGVLRLVTFGPGIDDGLIAVLAPKRAQLMPHGGPRVVQRLLSFLAEDLGGTQCPGALADPTQQYPEAADPIEALMLYTLVRATSPLAVDLLLTQPPRWRAVQRALLDGAPATAPLAPERLTAWRERARRLRVLLVPPTVVLAGVPNVGKSTLTNALLGRDISITADLQGTTRDYVGAMVDLGGLVVRWIDTPGLRPTDDPIEAAAIRLARRMIDSADLLIEAGEPGGGRPDLPRPADLAVRLKADRLGPGNTSFGSEAAIGPAGAMAVSAVTGQGLEAFAAAVRERLVPSSLLAPLRAGAAADVRAVDDAGLWLFDERLLNHLTARSGGGRVPEP